MSWGSPPESPESYSLDRRHLTLSATASTPSPVLSSSVRSHPTALLVAPTRTDINTPQPERLEALKTKDRADLLEVVWKIGIRQPQELADIEWEDVSEEGVTKIQFKALQRIGREHAAPSSDSTTLNPPTPGYETAKGELGLDHDCPTPESP